MDQSEERKRFPPLRQDPTSSLSPIEGKDPVRLESHSVSISGAGPLLGLSETELLLAGSSELRRAEALHLRRPVVPPLFSPDDQVGNRYKILRFIASGGMGEVYEAQDVELQERVALKIIRPEIARDTRMVERFKREIRLARKVTHPNICRIFDVSHYLDPSNHGTQEPVEEIPFLSMEFLEGETLGSRLWHKGAMSTDEALPLVRQMVEALAAAHHSGIVHRDFKSENVILVPSAAGDRPVITDFGLAFNSFPGENLSHSLTGQGNLVGTPAYMAPEQVEGGKISAATDIYALGVVMYEMVTGTRPFDGQTALQVALKRLKEEPPSPRTHVPDLDPKWEAAILRCLRRAPEDRFAHVEDVLAGLRDEADELPVAEARRLARFLALGVSAMMLLGVVTGYWVSEAGRAGGPSGPAAVQPAGSRSVAVLGLENLSGRPDVQWLSAGLAEMLGTELAAGGHLRTAARAKVALATRELELSSGGGLEKQALSRLREQLGAEVLVVGSYLVLGTAEAGKPSSRQIRLDLRLQDTNSGEIVASVARTGAEADLFGLISQTGAALRERLQAGPTP